MASALKRTDKKVHRSHQDDALDLVGVIAHVTTDNTDNESNSISEQDRCCNSGGSSCRSTSSSSGVETRSGARDGQQCVTPSPHGFMTVDDDPSTIIRNAIESPVSTLWSLLRNRKTEARALDNNDSTCNMKVEDSWLFLPNGLRLRLPSTNKGQKEEALDEYLHENVPCIVERNANFLSTKSFTGISSNNPSQNCITTTTTNAHVSINKDSYSSNFLNVFQGELAHATPCQADAVGSTNATTCHVLAIRSTLSKGGAHYCSTPLVSVAHIDRAGYASSLEAIIEHHLNFHSSNPNEYEPLFDEPQQKKARKDYISSTEVGDQRSPAPHSKSPSPSPRIVRFDIHLVGGFVDDRGLSQKLSSFLIRQLATMADQYKHRARITLQTCAVSCMNTRTTCCSRADEDEEMTKGELDSSNSNSNRNLSFEPVARGLVIYTQTGDVQVLNSVPPQLVGPGVELRDARLWVGRYCDELELIHNSCHPSCCGNKTNSHPGPGHNSTIVVEPFEYRLCSRHRRYLALKDDWELLRRTSTSPHCEASDYCDNVRRTFCFMRNVPCETVFGRDVDQAARYERLHIG
jgi:hypothetical protein